MATYTPNYNLKKPATSDFYDIADFNGNMDIIDEALNENADIEYDTTTRVYTANGKYINDNTLKYDWMHLPGLLILNLLVHQSAGYEEYILDLPEAWQPVSDLNGGNLTVSNITPGSGASIDELFTYRYARRYSDGIYVPYVEVYRYNSSGEHSDKSPNRMTLIVPVAR